MNPIRYVSVFVRRAGNTFRYRVRLMHDPVNTVLRVLGLFIYTDFLKKIEWICADEILKDQYNIGRRRYWEEM